MRSQGVQLCQPQKCDWQTQRGCRRCARHNRRNGKWMWDLVTSRRNSSKKNIAPQPKAQKSVHKYFEEHTSQASKQLCRNPTASHEKVHWTATALTPHKAQKGSPRQTHSCSGSGEHPPDKIPVVPRTAGPGQSTMSFLHCRARACRGMCIVTMPGGSRRVTIPIVPPNQPRHFLTPPACPQQWMGWLQTSDLLSWPSYSPFEARLGSHNYSGFECMTHPSATHFMEAQGDYSAPKEGMIFAKIKFAFEKVP